MLYRDCIETAFLYKKRVFIIVSTAIYMFACIY